MKLQEFFNWLDNYKKAFPHRQIEVRGHFTVSHDDVVIDASVDEINDPQPAENNTKS